MSHHKLLFRRYVSLSLFHLQEYLALLMQSDFLIEYVSPEFYFQHINMKNWLFTRILSILQHDELHIFNTGIRKLTFYLRIIFLCSMLCEILNSYWQIQVWELSVTLMDESIKISTKQYQWPLTLNPPWTDITQEALIEYNSDVITNTQNWLFTQIVSLLYNGERWKW